MRGSALIALALEIDSWGMVETTSKVSELQRKPKFKGSVNEVSDTE